MGAGGAGGGERVNHSEMYIEYCDGRNTKNRVGAETAQCMEEMTRCRRSHSIGSINR